MQNSKILRSCRRVLAPCLTVSTYGALVVTLSGCWLLSSSDDSPPHLRPTPWIGEQGSGGACTTADQCPAGSSQCVQPACVDGKCGFENAPALASCDDDGGQVCDGLGHCVECITTAECSTHRICQYGQCVPTQCWNHTQDGDESDVDCGGSVCPPCGTGMYCGSPSDCASGICTDGTCAAAVCGDGIVNGSEQCDGDGLGTGGETATCDANCTFVSCGDGQLNLTAGESCDDGNQDNTDDCPDGLNGTCQPASCADGFLHSTGSGDETDVDCGGSCLACPGGLLLTEVAVADAGAEFVEIHNPTAEAVSLRHVYMADIPSYYGLADGSVAVSADDFLVTFPEGSSIGAGETIVVSTGSAAAFSSSYGFFPSYDFDPGDTNAPAMEGVIGASAALADGAEVVVLFRWDGSSDLVEDIDIVLYGGTAEAVDKTGVTVGTSTYLADTPVASQEYAAGPATGLSSARCDLTEGFETAGGGNGYVGHDETSENLSQTWQVTRHVSPGRRNVCHIFSRSFGGVGSDSAIETATDSANNIVVAGNFDSDELDFGCGTLPHSGGVDVFVVKLTPDGATCLWSVAGTGADGLEQPGGVVVDGANNVIVAGRFASTAFDFGGSPVANTGSNDVFVAKLAAADGAQQWLVSAAGSDLDRPWDLALARDGSSDVFVVGEFSSADFVLGTPLTNPVAGTGQVFVARLTSGSGAVVWSKAFGGVGATNERGSGIAVDGANDVLLVGHFEAATLSVGGPDLSNTGDTDAFAAKLSGANGSHLWSTSAMGAGAERSTQVAVDGSGDVVVAGQFTSDVVSWGSSLNNSTPGAGADDVYVVKLAGSSGSQVWATSAVGDGGDQVWAVAVNGMGDIGLTGGFSSSTFGFGGTVPPAVQNGVPDVWLALLSGADGSNVWTIGGIGTAYDMGRSVCFDSAGSLVAAGFFRSEALSFEVASDMISTMAGPTEAFVTKFGP